MITELKNHIIIAKFLFRKFKNETAIIPKIILKSESHCPIKFETISGQVRIFNNSK